MIERYTRPEMGAVWSERRKLDAWLRVELAVVDALLAVAQMPPGVPVAAVGVDNPRNAAVLAARILSA